jgi:hypothetical protein
MVREKTKETLPLPVLSKAVAGQAHERLQALPRMRRNACLAAPEAAEDWLGFQGGFIEQSNYKVADAVTWFAFLP